MGRLLLIPLLLLTMLTPHGFGWAGAQTPERRAERCECCDASCDLCPCCVSDEMPQRDERQPYRISQGPRVEWVPAPERTRLGVSREGDERTSLTPSDVRVAVGQGLRLHARIGVWLN
jgi:hypothetical protein